MKKSQITVFIIIAVIIVVSFIALMLFFYGRDDDLEEHKDPVDIERINNFVEECIFQTGEDAVYRIGRTGGYSEASKYSTSNDIAYYYDKGRNLLPPKSEIENQLALYIKSNLNSCIKDFSDFPHLKITPGILEPKAVITENKIIFSAVYPITIEKNGETFTLEYFEDIEVKVRLGTIYNAIKEYIIDYQLKNKTICMTCLFKIALENDLLVELFDLDDETVLFIFRDDKSIIDNMPYRFRFAAKYDHKIENV